MKDNRSIPKARVVPVLIYPDVREAVEWLGAAFGFGEQDFAGHQWTFSETLADTAPEEWGGETITPR